MAIQILHAADFHMDSAFDALPLDKASQRRAGQRLLLQKIAELCQTRAVDIVLLSGDLFDSASSYFETHEALLQMFSSISVPIFIAPGNHDYYCSRSPYAFLSLPDNVHVFTKPTIEYVDLPQLGARVYGAGYGATSCPSLLSGFHAENPDLINIMVMHGDMTNGAYAPFTEADIANSGLDYLALGHVHTYSGILSAGKTHYAYPGCIEGRGFDETGKKGVIAGAVGKNGCKLDFIPLGGREYENIEIDLSRCENVQKAILDEAKKHNPDNICRFVLTGCCGARPNITRLMEQLQDKFYSVSFRDQTRPLTSVWEGVGDNSLRGIFLEKMKKQYDAAVTEEEKATLMQATRYGLAAIDGREEWLA